MAKRKRRSHVRGPRQSKGSWLVSPSGSLRYTVASRLVKDYLERCVGTVPIYPTVIGRTTILQGD